MIVDNSEMLFGVLSVQLGFATAGQVMACGAEWAARRGEKVTLATLLQDRGIITADQRRMVEGMLQKAVEANQGDVHRTMQSLSGGGQWLLKSLSESVVSGPRRDPSKQQDEITAQTDSLEGSENISDEPPGRYDTRMGSSASPIVELGRGGIGRVVLAHDHFLGRDVALKELLPEHTSNPAMATTRSVALEQRFLREARLTGQLEHPAIVPVYELGRRLGGGLYYTMQRVRGRTLWELIKEGKTLQGRLKQITVFHQVCQAIAYAHSRAVVHRDIKPQNVMVGAFGETFVLDWGLARIKGKTDPRARDLRLAPDITGNALEGGAIGTPSYMSPEQAEGKIEQIDERSDVWGLGAVLYEMLTGRPPYEGINPFDVLGKIIKAPVVPVKSLVPDAPGDLCAVAQKALQHDKALRYASAAEMAKDIQSYLSGGNVEAREYKSFELLFRFVRRNRALVTLGAIGLAVLLAFAGYSYRRVRAERDSAREFAQLFLDEVSNKLEPVAGSAALLEELNTRALDYYKRDVDPRHGPRDERLRMAKAWDKIGSLAYKVGKNDEAFSAYQFSIEIARPLVEEQPEDVTSIVLLSRALGGMANVLLLQKQSDKAATLTIEALELAKRAYSLDPNDDVVVNGYSSMSGSMGLLYSSRGDRVRAVEHFEKQLELDRVRLSRQPQNADVKSSVVRSLLDLSDLELSVGKADQALALLGEARTMAEQVVTMNPEKVRTRRSLGEALVVQALAIRALQRDGDEDLFDEGLKQLNQVLETDASDMYAQSLRDRVLLRLDPEQVYARLQRDDPSTLDVDFFQTYVVAAFLAGHDRQAIDNALVATDIAVTTASTYGALAAAFDDDAENAEKLARRAADDEGSDLDWVLDVLPTQAGGLDSPLRQQALVLMRRLDAATRAGDEKAQRQAIRDFADAVKQKK